MASRPVRVVRIERVVQKGRCHYTGRISSSILDNPLVIKEKYALCLNQWESNNFVITY